MTDQFCPFSPILFNCSWSLLLEFFFFFLSFYKSNLQTFSLSYQVRLFYPFFSFKLHTFVHKFVIFFKNFELKEFGVLDDFWCFWFWNDYWVFVYACCLHDFYALNKKISWFMKIFKIRVHVFLRKLEITFNWIKLAKIDHCCWLIDCL